ncbi:Sulfotransferase family protein [Balamuthia mandrillaris]
MRKRAAPQEGGGEGNKAKATDKGLLVIGSGDGRTGTMSMKVALERLGFGPCYHMIENLENGDSQKWYKRYVNAKDKPSWEDIFSKTKNYRSTVDFPSFVFYKELMEEYPEAKVIHTTREPEKWYASANQTIFTMFPGHYASFGLSLFFSIFPSARKTAQMIRTVSPHMPIIDDKQKAVKYFKARDEEVLRTVPKEKLLVFHPGDGWEPLCKFLGVPIPDEPFPHVNDTEDFKKIVAKLSRIGYIAAFALLALLLLLCFAGFKLLF